MEEHNVKTRNDATATDDGNEPRIGGGGGSFFDAILADSGYVDGGEGSSTRTPEPGRIESSTGSKRNRSRSRSDRGTGENRGRGATSNSNQKSTMGPEITVEDNPLREPVTDPDPVPAPKPKRNPRAKKRGPVTDQHVEGWTVQLFSIAAMIRGTHWAVHQPEVEVRPWAGSAADLINEHVNIDIAEKALALNAGVAVAIGIASMVMVRSQMDYELRRQAIAVAEATDRRPGTGHPQEVGTPPAAVANEELKIKPIPIRRSQTGGNGGAAPTRPDEPIEGLGMSFGGLS